MTSARSSTGAAREDRRNRAALRAESKARAGTTAAEDRPSRGPDRRCSSSSPARTIPARDFQFVELTSDGSPIGEPKEFTRRRRHDLHRRLGDQVLRRPGGTRRSAALDVGLPVPPRVRRVSRAESKASRSMPSGSRPAVYSQGNEMSPIERDIWANFWEYCQRSRAGQEERRARRARRGPVDPPGARQALSRRAAGVGRSVDRHRRRAQAGVVVGARASSYSGFRRRSQESGATACSPSSAKRGKTLLAS